MSQRTQLTLLSAVCARIRKEVSPIACRLGVHTSTYLQSAGFQYTGKGDTACCVQCGLEVSNWTKDMNPFTIHSQHSGICPSVISFQSPLHLPPSALRNLTIPNKRDGSPESPAVEAADVETSTAQLNENDSLRLVRERTFSRWSDVGSIPCKQFIDAGFFDCNVGDRVICIYCNLICQHWTPHVDVPCDVHKTLSPNCPYVRGFLTARGSMQIINAYGNSLRSIPSRTGFQANSVDLLHISRIVRPVRENGNSTRTRNDPYTSEGDEQIQANYYFTNEKTDRTCKYCNKLLTLSEPDQNPVIDHILRNPKCPYVALLVNNRLYQQLLASRPAGNEHKRASDVIDTTDPVKLARLVAARLDWPMSRRWLNKPFEFSIIKRCWEDQLRIKNMNFLDEKDLYMACLILQKQIDCINGRQGNITVPSKSMTSYLGGNRLPNRATFSQRTTSEHLNDILADASLSSASQNDEPSKLCVLCLSEEKCLACIPCGHLATCVPCGHSLRSCPICRGDIQAFIRVYV